MKLQQLLLYLLLGLAIACNSKTDKVTSVELTDVYNLSSNDEEMNSAIEKARQSVSQFWSAFESGDATLSTFALKMAFPDAIGGHEHIWIVDLTREDNEYYGIVGNEPVNTTHVVIGQRIKIEESRISDWMYLKDNVLQGGYTLRVLRSRMTPEEQKQFDYSVGFVIPE